MKKLLHLIFIIAITNSAALPAHNSGSIIILHGTSSAGKTSIMQELQKLDYMNYYACDIDNFMKTFLIENPMSSTDRDYNMQLFTTLFNSFFRMIQNITDTGKTVLCDSVDTFFTEKIYQTFPGTNIITVLVYLPLDAIQQRVDYYNLGCALEQNKKTAFMAARQFIELYTVLTQSSLSSDRIPNPVRTDTSTLLSSKRPPGLRSLGEGRLEVSERLVVSFDKLRTNGLKTNTSNTEHIVDTITSDSIKTAFQQITTTPTPIPFVQRTYNTAVKSFSLDTSTTINLIATIPYDLMVNNGTHSQQENARIIHDYVTKL